MIQCPKLEADEAQSRCENIFSFIVLHDIASARFFRVVMVLRVGEEGLNSHQVIKSESTRSQFAKTVAILTEIDRCASSTVRGKDGLDNIRVQRRRYRGMMRDGR
ncbi:unnamed protein product [Strongylus vulgaris]|uniref:Uncharacterized protein n=1 Tax=Strongylus vulgaris TaxID=40348 RepID=A0A3P7HYX8_STRVU|nr:unnamed protein product [Strongylus vulgaris]